jgi:hypothetical protein
MKRYAVPRWSYNTALNIKKRVGICQAPTQGPKVPPPRALHQVRFLNFRLIFLLLGSCLQWLSQYTLFLVSGCQVAGYALGVGSIAGVSIARPTIVLRNEETKERTRILRLRESIFLQARLRIIYVVSAEMKSG